MILDLPWIVLALMAITAFAVFETMGLRHPEHVNTLSRSIYNLGKNWPLSIFLMGMFAGGLAVHFFWHWCPELMPVGVGG